MVLNPLDLLAFQLRLLELEVVPVEVQDERPTVLLELVQLHQRFPIL